MSLTNILLAAILVVELLRYVPAVREWWLLQRRHAAKRRLRRQTVVRPKWWQRKHAENVRGREG